MNCSLLTDNMSNDLGVIILLLYLLVQTLLSVGIVQLNAIRRQ